jgi:hypothetical protein
LTKIFEDNCEVLEAGSGSKTAKSETAY